MKEASDLHGLLYRRTNKSIKTKFISQQASPWARRSQITNSLQSTSSSRGLAPLMMMPSTSFTLSARGYLGGTPGARFLRILRKFMKICERRNALITPRRRFGRARWGCITHHEKSRIFANFRKKSQVSDNQNSTHSKRGIGETPYFFNVF